MNLNPLSERSDSELRAIADLSRETSVGYALYSYGLNFVDLAADPVGHLILSIMLEDEDRQELAAWWQLFLATDVSEMNVSMFKRLPDRPSNTN
jgi:hypothetical protein